MSPGTNGTAEREAYLNRYHSEWWENPRDVRTPVFRRLNDLVFERLPRGPGRALDIGAGRGTLTAMLRDRGFGVTAVEMSPEFAANLRSRYPDVRVVEANAQAASLEGIFDIALLIEVSQNFRPDELQALLGRLARQVRRLHMNVTNRFSFHGWWNRVRGFRNPYAYLYCPAELDRMLGETGFRVVFRRGVGLLTPVTWHSGFRGKVFPQALAAGVNRLDPYAPRACHLYYVEAVPR